MAINQACREQLLRNAICCVCPKGEMNKYESPQKQQKVSVIQCNLTKIYFSSKTPMEAGLNSKLSLIRRKKIIILLSSAQQITWADDLIHCKPPTDLSWPLAFLLYYLTTYSYSLQVQYLHNQENKLCFGVVFTVFFIPSIVLHI